MAAGHTIQAPDTITPIGPSGAFTPADETSAFPGGVADTRDFGKKISSRGQRGAID
jgi:hypothetical protein